VLHSIFFYLTLNRILIEQSALQSLQATTSELWAEIQSSSGYLSDLKTAKKLPASESQLEKNIFKAQRVPDKH